MIITKIVNGLKYNVEESITKTTIKYITDSVKNKFCYTYNAYAGNNSPYIWLYLHCKNRMKRYLYNKHIYLNKGTYIFKMPDNKTFCVVVYDKFNSYDYNTDSEVNEYFEGEILKFHFVGKHAKQYFDSITRYRYVCKSNELISIYDGNSRVYISKRDEKSLILDDKNTKKIYSSIDKWIEQFDLYKSLSICHKIGIILYGKPGTGKSSIIKILGSKYASEIVMINQNTIDNTLKSYSNYINNKPVLFAFEDIDCITINRDTDTLSKEDKEYFYKILQLLDGVSSLSNVIFVATTNHIDKLDPALVREGRFDIKIEMKDLDKQLAEKMCENFKLSKPQIKSILKDVDFPINPAALQAKILYELK